MQAEGGIIYAREEDLPAASFSFARSYSRKSISTALTPVASASGCRLRISRRISSTALGFSTTRLVWWSLQCETPSHGLSSGEKGGWAGAHTRCCTLGVGAPRCDRRGWPPGC